MNQEIARAWNLRQLDADAIPPEILAELVRRGAVCAQRELSLPVDGLAGPMTIEALEEHLGVRDFSEDTPPTGTRFVEIPTPRGVEAVYGSFRYKSHPEQTGAIVIEREWVRANIVKVKIPYTNRHTWMHRLVADEFKSLFARAVEATGNQYTPAKVWSWVARRKMWRDDKSPSMHSWGVAVDIDPHLNKYGTETGPLYDFPEFVDVFESAGWSWGGRWRTPDPHHFERIKR